MSKTIVIKKGLKLGELDAEADEKYLDRCFVDTGYISTLLDTDSPASIILGRTGSGKSALIYGITKNARHVTAIDPTDISIRFLEHSNIIEFLTELGVNLDLFYRLLWKHVLMVELLRQLYGREGLRNSKSLLDRLFGIQQPNDPLKAKAKKYFEEWGDKFWLETDEQLRELTERFQSKIEAAFKAQLPHVDISLDGAKNLEKEIRTEIRNKTNRVVSGLQVQRLNELINHLEENEFPDRQKKYYITIDALDENWATTETRCRVIRALIEEIKSLRTLTHVKVIIALRNDLLVQVIDRTRDSGFQQEKYDAYLLELRWDPDQLRQLIESRINEVAYSGPT